MPDEFDDAMTLIGRAIRQAEALDDATLDPDRLARWAFTLDGAVKRLRVLHGEATALLAEMVPHGQPTILDGMIVEADRTSTRTGWDNERVRSLVIQSARFDPRTGVARDADEAVEVIGKLYPLGGQGLRLTAARDLIPDWVDDELCRVEPKVKVKITEPTTVAKKEKV